MDNYSDTEVDIEDKPISLTSRTVHKHQDKTDGGCEVQIKLSQQNPILVSFDPQFNTTDIKHEISQRVSFQKPTIPSY